MKRSIPRATRKGQRATLKLRTNSLCVARRALSAKKGLILVFTGDGKGKTTAALGTALRMIRRGGRVGMVEFFKRRTPYALPRTRFQVWNFGGGFTWNTPKAENQKAVNAAWKKCRELLRDPKYNLVIFDEIHIALKYKFLLAAKVVKALKKRSGAQHVILTGRGAPKAILKAADLVTEMKCLKHPFHRGIPAVPGLDF